MANCVTTLIGDVGWSNSSTATGHGPVLTAGKGLLSVTYKPGDNTEVQIVAVVRKAGAAQRKMLKKYGEGPVVLNMIRDQHSDCCCVDHPSLENKSKSPTGELSGIHIHKPIDLPPAYAVSIGGQRVSQRQQSDSETSCVRLTQEIAGLLRNRC